MGYSAKDSWTRKYTVNADIAYPAEGVIRILKGTFPDLAMPKPEPGDSIVDVGCGDGRHLPLFHSLGMQSFGVEISDDIVSGLQDNMATLKIPADIRVGHAGDIPFDDDMFDYLLTWNSCYYMSIGSMDFRDHVDEMARVLKPGGWIICSIPKMECFIFKDSIEHSVKGYRVIQNDYFNARNGEVMRCMESREDVERSFASRFTDFCHASIDMQWFGLAYNWYVFTARKSR